MKTCHLWTGQGHTVGLRQGHQAMERKIRQQEMVTVVAEVEVRRQMLIIKNFVTSLHFKKLWKRTHLNSWKDNNVVFSLLVNKFILRHFIMHVFSCAMFYHLYCNSLWKWWKWSTFLFLYSLILLSTNFPEQKSTFMTIVQTLKYSVEFSVCRH